MNGISTILKPIVTIILLSLLIACHNDTDPPPPPPPTGERGDGEVNIEGDWKASCKKSSEDGTSTIDSFKFSKDDFTYEKHFYSDTSCSQALRSNKRTGKITYQGEELKRISGKDAYEKDFRFDDDGEEWKSLVALENNDTTLYLAPGFDGAARPDDFTGKNVYTLKKGTVEPLSQVDIDGTWKTECLYSEDDKLGYIFIFNVSEDRFSFQADQYSDSSCANSKDSGTRSGKVRYGEKLTTSSGRTAYELDLLFDNGDIEESLVARQGDTIILKLASEGASRPDDLTGGIEFSKDSGPEGHVDIDGTWKTDCAYFEDEEFGTIIIFEVSGESFSLQTSIYSDNSCTQSKGSALDGGEITYGKKVTTPSGLTAHEIDLQFNQDGDVWNGSTWESLVARQGSTLLLNPDLEGTGRPIDFRGAIEFSKR